jgi:hypothetical protein
VIIEKRLQNILDLGCFDKQEIDTLIKLIDSPKTEFRSIPKRSHWIEWVGAVFLAGLLIFFFYGYAFLSFINKITGTDSIVYITTKQLFDSSDLLLFMGIIVYGTIYLLARTDYSALWEISNVLETLETTQKRLLQLHNVLIKKAEDPKKYAQILESLLRDIHEIEGELLWNQNLILQNIHKCRVLKRGIYGILARLIGPLPECDAQRFYLEIPRASLRSIQKSQGETQIKSIHCNLSCKVLSALVLLFLSTVGFMLLRTFVLQHNFIALAFGSLLIILTLVPALMHFYQNFFIPISWNEKALYYGKKQIPLPWESLRKIGYSPWMGMDYFDFEPFKRIWILGYVQGYDDLGGPLEILCHSDRISNSKGMTHEQQIRFERSPGANQGWS